MKWLLIACHMGVDRDVSTAYCRSLSGHDVEVVVVVISFSSLWTELHFYSSNFIAKLEEKKISAE